MAKIRLLPGDLNDANRSYLPLEIKGSKMVVNENGNNSQVYPERLSEFHEDILEDGITDEWYEYVPESYDPAKPAPLVFSMHGGLMSGWGQCIYTGWSYVADKEGFICVFPNASAKKMWMIECHPSISEEMFHSPSPDIPALNHPTGRVPEFHDVRLVLALLERMKHKYNIDSGRVYIQGMSMGNAMTSQVVRYHGDLFAGAAGSGCPTNCRLLFDDKNELINEGGALDIWQSRLEYDKTPPHYGEDDRPVILGNNNYWRRLNGAEGLPQIAVRGDKNYAFYEGSRGNVVLMDVYNRDHGQTLDDAQIVWDYLFSGVYRDGQGVLRHTEPNRPRTGDAFSIAVSEGGKKAWVNNRVVSLNGRVFRRDKLKYHGLSGDSIIRGSYLYVPVSFIADTFGASWTPSEDGLTGLMKLSDGRNLEFAHSCICCTIDNTLEQMLCDAICVDGMLYIPLEWFCADVMNLHVSGYDDTLYVTDHTARLSRYMAWILSDILKEQPQRGAR